MAATWKDTTRRITEPSRHRYVHATKGAKLVQLNARTWSSTTA
jgi:hypothetical protein